MWYVFGRVSCLTMFNSIQNILCGMFLLKKIILKYLRISGLVASAFDILIPISMAQSYLCFVGISNFNLSGSGQSGLCEVRV